VGRPKAPLTHRVSVGLVEGRHRNPASVWVPSACLAALCVAWHGRSGPTNHALLTGPAAAFLLGPTPPVGNAARPFYTPRVETSPASSAPERLSADRCAEAAADATWRDENLVGGG
jgi:hypothetical protein